MNSHLFIAMINIDHTDRVGEEVTKGVGKVVQELYGAGDHVGNNIGSWAIGEVMVVIEMVVDE